MSVACARVNRVINIFGSVEGREFLAQPSECQFLNKNTCLGVS